METLFSTLILHRNQISACLLNLALDYVHHVLNIALSYMSISCDAGYLYFSNSPAHTTGAHEVYTMLYTLVSYLYTCTYADILQILY